MEGLILTAAEWIRLGEEELLQEVRRHYPQAEAAQILGYSDQSHYTREFKEFSGVCPCQFQKQI